ncbi:hypothetical protein CYLTODRAFT_23206 [Cylindrobasidium torrendii FP15055 ss-10]|uniref:Decapping nuclease n=1 Tax=Cylindrobasidium torrendii FP15055 ss-10 TaxID=1314674 RepID=A0A0D7B8C4_9AGAR|nr:hypothetical protein CYLTODRAFT_23206 [Cylindrobasidium torrendii FP15055 ss-10]
MTRPVDGSPVSTHGHYRILAYGLGGVRLVVYCEEDSCIVRTRNHITESTTQIPPLANVHPTDTAERLINVVHWGTVDPSLKTVELKVAGHIRSWKEYYEQMFFGQTSEIVVGVHKDGVVDRVVSKTLENMTEQDDALQPAFGQLAATLRWIQTLVKGNRDLKLSLVCKGHELKVFERFEGPSLPQRYKHLFTSRTP